MATESVPTVSLSAVLLPDLRGSIFHAKAELEMGTALLDLISDSEAEQQIQNAILGVMVLLRRVESRLQDAESLADRVAKAVAP